MIHFDDKNNNTNGFTIVVCERARLQSYRSS
jgi:hypothetical protein